MASVVTLGLIESAGLDLLRRLAARLDASFRPDESKGWEPNGGERTEKKGRIRELVRHRLGTPAMAFIRELETRRSVKRPEVFYTLTLRTLKLAGAQLSVQWDAATLQLGDWPLLSIQGATDQLIQSVEAPMPRLDEPLLGIGEDALLQLLISVADKLFPDRVAALFDETATPLNQGYESVYSDHVSYGGGKLFRIWVYATHVPATYGRPGDYTDSSYKIAVIGLPAGHELYLQYSRSAIKSDETTLCIRAPLDVLAQL